MYRRILIAAIVALPVFAFAQTTDQQITNLLSRVAELQKQLQMIPGSTNTTAVSGQCVVLTKNLVRGSIGDEVLRLQQFLITQGLLAAGGATGQYDVLTEVAVQRWQSSHGIVSAGTPETTGYGATGPRTRYSIANCATSSGTQIPGQIIPLGQQPIQQCPYVPIPGSCTGSVQPIRASANNSASCIIGWQCTSNGPGTLPAQTFNASVRSGPAPLEVVFSGLVTSASAGWCNGNVCPSVLEFGDGPTGTVFLPSTPNTALSYTLSHTYTRKGTYTAKLHQGDDTKPLVGSPIIIDVATSTSGSSTTTPYISLSLAPSALRVHEQLGIRWATLNAPQNAAVRLKIDGGASIAQGLDAEEATTTYNWIVPTMATGTYRVIAELYASSNLATASASFTLRDDTSGVCLAITHNLGPDDTDAATDGDVSRLQEFLALDSETYPEGRISGFYGPATVRAVQRWQSAHGILSSGSPESNGYGAAGPRTRAAMTAGCSGSAILSATPRSGAAPLEVTFTTGAVTTSYFGGTRIEYGDGASAIVCNPGSPCAGSTVKHVYTNAGAFIARYVGLGEGSSTVLGSVSINTTGGGGPSSSCAEISHAMGPDDTDASTEGDVSRLQQFLAKDSAIYPEGLVTGFYGPATVRAVQRWQSGKGIVTSGTPETTGYGAVGPRTLALIACGGQPAAGFTASPTSGEAPLRVTFTYVPVSEMTTAALFVDFGDSTGVGGMSTVDMICPTPQCAIPQKVTHIYTTTGTHTGRLFQYVRDASECTGLSGTALDICNIGRRATLGTAQITVKSPVTCPSGQVKDSNGSCVVGSCASGQVRDSSGLCVASCAVGKFIDQNNQCVDSCPSGQAAEFGTSANSVANNSGRCTPVTGSGTCEVPDGKSSRINQNEIVRYGDWVKVPNTAPSLTGTAYHPTMLYVCLNGELYLLNDIYCRSGDSRCWAPTDRTSPNDGRL
ncbi:peptidoglycan-binding protein [Candidatus Kaiserbacteria bacterium]|nr:peptidoglycan-binding protein [Candidatus Kaiserbacteria bacterium]